MARLAYGRRRRATPIGAPDEEREAFQRLDAALENGESEPKTCLIVNGQEILLPSTALRILATATHILAEGEQVSLVPVQRDLTTQDAADLLGCSRMHVTRLCDRGELPYHMAGNQRRIAAQDLADYMARDFQESIDALDETTRIGEAIDEEREVRSRR